MNKIYISIITFITISLTLWGQEQVIVPDSQPETSNGELVNKKGERILPEAGNFAIGMDADPVLDYIGNFLSQSDYGNTLDINSANIYGRYFLSSKTAIRLNVYIDNYINESTFYIQDDAAVFADPLSQSKVIDKRTQKSSDWMVTGGLEKFIGKGRIQGFYGFDIGYGKSRNKFNYSYGNEMTIANQAPTTVNNWGSGASVNQDQRNIRTDSGLSHDILAGPVAGVEYFFAPKICIGAEMHITLTISKATEGDYSFEEWINNGIVESDVESSPEEFDIDLYTSGLGSYGGIYLMFHF